MKEQTEISAKNGKIHQNTEKTRQNQNPDKIPTL
jgi:hypothetical protein